MAGTIDFLVLGAEKSGTTWLADMLRRHPLVFIPPEKELFYFNDRFFESPELPNYNAAQPLSWYLAFFRDASPDQRKGEASPAYLWDEAAPRRIRDFEPRLKLITILREPIERAFSQYLYYIQRGVSARWTFEQAIERRPDLLTRGLYAGQLGRYFDLFPAENMHIAFFDDLRRDGPGFLAAVQNFLDLPVQIPEEIDAPSNVTGEPRFPLVNRAIAWLRYPLRKYNPPGLMRVVRMSGLARIQERVRLANTRPLSDRPAIAAATRLRLLDYFRDDVLALQAMTGRDLGSWLVPPAQKDAG